jgi:hypothetical protein
MLDQRGQLLRAAVGFAGCSMPSYDRALHALRSWLDSWSGIGHVTVDMARQGFDLQLTRYDEKGWRATSTRAGWSIRRRARWAPMLCERLADPRRLADRCSHGRSSPRYSTAMRAGATAASMEQVSLTAFLAHIVGAFATELI